MVCNGRTNNTSVTRGACVKHEKRRTLFVKREEREIIKTNTSYPCVYVYNLPWFSFLKTPKCPLLTCVPIGRWKTVRTRVHNVHFTPRLRIVFISKRFLRSDQTRRTHVVRRRSSGHYRRFVFVPHTMYTQARITLYARTRFARYFSVPFRLRIELSRRVCRPTDTRTPCPRAPTAGIRTTFVLLTSPEGERACALSRRWPRTRSRDWFRWFD